MRYTFVFILLLLLNSCSISQNTSNTSVSYIHLINKDTLSKNLYSLASDEFEGRKTGEIGQKKAADFIKKQYQNYNISAPSGTPNYFQSVPSNFMGNILKDSENVLAYIPGSEFPDEVIVISAHYDHMGKGNLSVFYGADDNASGTAAVLEIARIFKKAVSEGNRPKRSLLFIHFTAEEFGLFGSRYYVENPLFPLKNTVANLNIDMIGRVANPYLSSPNYIYLVGSDRLSSELHTISEQANTKYTQLNLDYKYNEPNDPEMIYYRSDHYNFAKNGIPSLFYYNGPHPDYHKESDTADKINYPLLKKRVELIFATAWELANRTKRIIADKN